MVASLSQGTTAVGAVGGALTIVTLWVWNGTRDIRDQYGSEFEEMMNYYWSQFSSELNELVLRILEEADFDVSDEDFDSEETVELETIEVIETQIDRDELEGIEDSLREFDRPNSLYDRIKENYDSAWKGFGLSAIAVFGLSLSLGFLEQSDTTVGLQYIIASVALLYFIGGIRRFKEAREAEKELDDLIDDYRRDF